MKHESGSASARGTLLGVVAPGVVALLVWILAAPRVEIMSVGGGRGLPLSDAGADGGSQFLMLVLLQMFAVVCATVVLWHRHPGLRRPSGVPALVLLPALACAVLAAVASPLAALVAGPSEDIPRGDVVGLAPQAGEMFVGGLIYGTIGPDWEVFPPGTGWLVLGALVSAFTVAALAYFNFSADLRGGRDEGTDDAAAADDSATADDAAAADDSATADQLGGSRPASEHEPTSDQQQHPGPESVHGGPAERT